MLLLSDEINLSCLVFMSGNEIEVPVLVFEMCCRFLNLNLTLRRHLEVILNRLLSVEFRSAAVPWRKQTELGGTKIY